MPRSTLRVLALVLVGLMVSSALPAPPASMARRGGVLRMSGGKAEEATSTKEAVAGAEGGTGQEGLRASAKRRAEQAKAAGKPGRVGIGKTFYRVCSMVSNRMGVTGSSTRVVNGKIVLSRNPVQKLLHMVYLFFRAIYLFFKTLFVPLATLDRPKPSGGPGRGNFSTLNKKKEMRMADLPPMPGG